jgi:hypothetical protein
MLEDLPKELVSALGPLLETIGELTERIREYERELEEIAPEHYPETQILRQVEGIGTLTALTFVLVLEDPHRFSKSRSVGAYLGLVPGEDQSGESDPQQRISKEGDKMLRRLMVGSAHYILGPFAHDSDLRRHGLKNSQTWWEECQETGGGGRGEKALRALAPPLDHRRTLRAALQRAQIWKPGSLGPRDDDLKRLLERGGEVPGTVTLKRRSVDCPIASDLKAKARLRRELWSTFQERPIGRLQHLSSRTRIKTDLILCTEPPERERLTESADGSMARAANVYCRRGRHVALDKDGLLMEVPF